MKTRESKTADPKTADLGQAPAATPTLVTPLTLAVEDRYRLWPLWHAGNRISRELVLANRYPVRL
jgi:hypothetical protein